jgi:hypothetical protein
VIGLGAALFVCAVVAPFTRRNAIRGLGLLAVFVHFPIIAVSATTLSIPRYVVPIDPLVLVAGVLVAHAICMALRRSWSGRADAVGRGPLHHADAT